MPTNPPRLPEELEKIASVYDFIDVPEAPIKAEVSKRVCDGCRNGTPSVVRGGVFVHRAKTSQGIWESPCAASVLREGMDTK